MCPLAVDGRITGVAEPSFGCLVVAPEAKRVLAALVDTRLGGDSWLQRKGTSGQHVQMDGHVHTEVDRLTGRWIVR